MCPSASLLTTLLFALSIAATPLEVRTPQVTLLLAKHINNSGGIIKLLEHDQARAAALKYRGAAIQNGKLNRRADSTPDTNVGVLYIAAVAIGNPATTCMLSSVDFHHTRLKTADNLLLDTGSSTTWVGAGQPYKQTSTSKDTGQPVVSFPKTFGRETDVHILP